MLSAAPLMFLPKTWPNSAFVRRGFVTGVSALAGEWATFSLQQVTLASWAGLLYLGLLGSALGNTAYLWLLDRYSAPVIATYTFVNPVIAVILGVIVLGESVTIVTLRLGACAVLDRNAS